MFIHYLLRFIRCINYSLLILVIVYIVFPIASTYMVYEVFSAISPIANSLYNDSLIDYVYKYLEDNIYPLYIFLHRINVEPHVEGHYSESKGYYIYSVYWKYDESFVTVHIYSVEEDYVITGLTLFLLRDVGYNDEFINEYGDDVVDAINNLFTKNIEEARNHSFNLECIGEGNYSRDCLLKIGNVSIVFYDEFNPKPLSIRLSIGFDERGFYIEYVNQLPIAMRCLEKTSPDKLRWKIDFINITRRIYKYLGYRLKWKDLASISLDDIEEDIWRSYLIKNDSLVPVYIFRMTGESWYILLYINGSSGEIIGEECMSYPDTLYEESVTLWTTLPLYYLVIIAISIALVIITYILIFKGESIE